MSICIQLNTLGIALPLNEEVALELRLEHLIRKKTVIGTIEVVANLEKLIFDSVAKTISKEDCSGTMKEGC